MADQTIPEEGLPTEQPGAALRQAREAMGLNRADIAARTKIAERHIVAIEEDRFTDLASSTYAVGFSRAYARVVGLNEREVVQAVRDALARADAQEPWPLPAFEPGDPARVPAISVAWLAAIGAVLAIALVWYFWPSRYSPAVELPDLTDEPVATPSAAALATPSAAALATPSAAALVSGPVVLTATQPVVWIRVYDTAGAQLFQKELAQGESYTVPADANGPMIRTARPDALAVTVGGKAVAPLADRQMTISDVPVSAAALLARGAPFPAASSPAASSPAVSPSGASPAASVASVNPPSARQRESAPSPPRPRESAPPQAEPPVIEAAVASMPGETSTVSE